MQFDEENKELAQTKVDKINHYAWLEASRLTLLEENQVETVDQEKFKNYKPKENYNIGEKVVYQVSPQCSDFGKITKIIRKGGKTLYEVENERCVQQFEAHELAAEVAQTFSDGADVEQQYAEQVKDEEKFEFKSSTSFFEVGDTVIYVGDKFKSYKGKVGTVVEVCDDTFTYNVKFKEDVVISIKEDLLEPADGEKKKVKDEWLRIDKLVRKLVDIKKEYHQLQKKLFKGRCELCICGANIRANIEQVHPTFFEIKFDDCTAVTLPYNEVFLNKIGFKLLEGKKEEIAENTNCTKNQRNEGKFKVGDRVWSPIYGKGVVEKKEFTNYMWYWVKFDNAHELLIAICDTGAKRYAWRKEHELLPENEAPENESETDFKIGYKVMIANQKLETHGKKGVITDIFDNGKLAVSLEGEQFFYFYYPADVKLLKEQSIEKEDRNKYSNAEQPAEQKQEEYVPQVGDVVEYITENKYWKGAIGIVKKLCSSTQVDVKFIGRDGLFTVANTCLKPCEYKVKYKKMDNVTEFVCDICGIFDKLKETFVKKNKQYATSDPLANFRTGALLKYHKAGYPEMYEEAKDYQRKHIAHIQNNTINGPKVEESLADNAIYSIIELYMWRKQHDQNNSKQ